MSKMKDVDAMVKASIDSFLLEAWNENLMQGLRDLGIDPESIDVSQLLDGWTLTVEPPPSTAPAAPASFEGLKGSFDNRDTCPTSLRTAYDGIYETYSNFVDYYLEDRPDLPAYEQERLRGGAWLTLEWNEPDAGDVQAAVDDAAELES